MCRLGKLEKRGILPGVPLNLSASPDRGGESYLTAATFIRILEVGTTGELRSQRLGKVAKNPLSLIPQGQSLE